MTFKAQNPDLSSIFYPQSIAVIGASADERGPVSDGWLGRMINAGYRGSAPVNLDALKDILFKISEFAAKTPEVREIDLNPIFARPNDAIAVDARIILE